MKTKIKRYSRSVLSVLLSVCIVMSCMAVGIVGTSAAQTDEEAVGYGNSCRVKGSWDNWALHELAGTSFSVTLAGNTDYSFVYIADNNDQFSSNATISTSISNYNFSRNDNDAITLHTGAAGTYKFTFNGFDGGQTSMQVSIEFPSVTITSMTAVGDSTALFGTAWAPTATSNDMTPSGNIWTKTWSNVSLPVGTIKYKVAANHSWAITYPSENKTQSVTTAGIYDVTIRYNATDNSVSMTLTNKTTHKFTLAPVSNAVVKATYNSTTIQEGSNFAKVPQGDKVTITVTPDLGYKIGTITATNGGTISGSGNTRTVTMPNADTTLTVEMTSVGKRIIYYNNNNTKYAMVTAKYTYNGETVTNTMTRLPNSNIWSIEVPGDLGSITFIGDNGYNTGSQTIPSASTNSSPMYTGGFTPSNPSSGGSWKTYSERGNVYTVTKGSTLENANLFTGISATFYDYYTDGEITSNNWIGGIGAKEYSRHNGSKFTWNTFSKLNSAISDYSSASKNNVWRPLYFGNLNVSSKESDNTYSIDKVGGGNSSIIKNYTGWDQDVNNSINLNPDTKSITGLSGQTLAGSTIHNYKSGATNENGAPMSIFDEDFLSGLNNQNTALATILRSPAFPVRKTSKSSHDYYEFDSTNGKDNAYFESINKTNKTAELNYYNSSSNKTVASSTPSGTSKGFFPFDYDANVKNNTSDFWSTDYIYLDVSNTTGGTSWWACFRNNSNESYSYVKMDNVSGHLYRCLNPDWASKVAFTKNSNNNAPSGNWGDGNNVYNYITDKTVPTGNNKNIMFKTSGYSGQQINGSWAEPNAQYLSHRAHDLGFGAKLEIPFTLEQGGYFHDNNAAQVFEFSGDDDLWVFIDNKLVLDLGGAHCKAQGSINFKDETVSVTTGQQAANSSSAAQRNINFGDWFDNSNPNQPHTMTIYYLERGMYDSNLKFGFSFHPIPNQFNAEKKVRTANINGGFYTINSTTKSENMTLDGGRAITKFEETYQNENFEIAHKIDNSSIGALDYTLTEKDDSQTTGIKTTQLTVSGGKYVIQNDDLATFVKNINKDTTFNLKESFPTSNKYKYTPSIEVYDDGNSGLKFDSVTSTPTVAGKVKEETDGSYTFKFSETHPITGMDNLNIRARFINQMNSHDLTIKKETNDPSDTTSTFELKVLFKFGDYDYTAYPLTCTLNGVDTALGADGSITVKNGDTVIIPKVPENAQVQILENLSDSSPYSYVGTDVKYSDGTSYTGTVTPSITDKNVKFAIGTKDMTAVVKNRKGSLSTNHTLYDSPIGSGNTYTTIYVKDSSGGTIKTYPKTGGMIDVDPVYIKANSTNKLEIVLETSPNSGYKFDEFYESISGTIQELQTSGTGYTAVFDPSGTKVTVTVLISALFSNNEQTFTLLPFYSKLSVPEKTLTINKTIDIASSGEENFDVKVEYFDGNDWVAYNDEGNATDEDGIGSVAANGTLTVTLKGVAATNEIRVTEVQSSGTKYQTPDYALTSGGTVDGEYSGDGIAFTSTLTQNPVVSITNNIIRQNFTITKKIDSATTAGGTFVFTVKLNGNLIPNTYQYKVGNGTATNFNNGTATISGVKADTTITVLNVPVGASIEVYESNSGTDYSLNNVIFTTGTGTVDTNKHATFTVTKGTTHALEFTNWKKQTVTIKKELIAADSDVDDPASSFKFKITVNGAAYSSAAQIDGATYNPVNGVYEIKRNQTLTLNNIDRGAVVNVVETDHNDTYYQYDSTTVNGATRSTPDAIDGKTDGAKFTVGSSNVAVVVKNKARRVNVIVKKTTDFPDDDGSLFTVTVKSRQFNSANNKYVANNNGDVTRGVAEHTDGAYQLYKDGYITFENVPKGTFFEVNETSKGTSNVTHAERFTLNNVRAYPTSTENNPQYITIEDTSTHQQTDILTGNGVPITDNTTFVVSNKVKRNSLIITKNIKDSEAQSDTQTQHELTITMLRNGAGSDACTGLKYQTRENSSAAWGAEQNFTSGGKINIVHGQEIKFQNLPLGTYVTITEKTINGNYTFDSFVVANASNITTNSSTVSFMTTDSQNATNVTIHNKLQRFKLDVTKLTNSKVADSFNVKVQTSSAVDGTYTDHTFTQAGQFTISGLSDTEAFAKYNSDTHEITLTKDQKLTVNNLAINTYVKVVETGTGTYHEWQNYEAVSGTTIKNSPANAASGAVVQMTADQELKINNKIKTKNVKIVKTTDFKNESQDFNFTVSIKRSGETSADAITGYKYTPNGNITATQGTTEFASTGEFTLQKDGSIVIYNVPVQATVTVTEASPTNGYSFNKTDSSGATFTDAGVATLTVPNDSNPTVTFANTKGKTVTIKKTTDWNNTADEFTFNVKKNDINYSGTAVTDYKVFNGSDVEQTRSFTNGNITLKKDEYVVIYGVKTGDKFQVKETVNSKYTLDSVSGTVSADDTAFTITNDNASLTYLNKIKKNDVKIQKVITDSSDTQTSFPLSIKVTKTANEPANQEFALKSSVTSTAEKTINEGTALTTAAIRGGETLTIKDVPIGYNVEVIETEAQTGSFEFDKIEVTENTAASSNITASERKATLTTKDAVAEVKITNKPIVRDIEITKSVDHGTGTFYVTVGLGSNFATSYQKKSSGGEYGAAQTVGSDNKIEIQPGDTIKISNVPINTAVTVKEVDIPDSFTYDSTTVSGATGTELTGGNRGTSFTMGASIVEVNINNTELHTLTVTKTTNVNNTTDKFTFKAYYKNSESDAWTAIDESIQITKGGTWTSPAKYKQGTLFKVVEVVPAKYSYNASGSSVTGATASTAITNGFENITMGTTDVTVTANNVVKTKNVTIIKNADYTESTDGAFTFNVKTKAEGASEATNCTYKYKLDGTGSELNFNNGNVTLTSGQSIVIYNVPVDTEVTVQETNAGTATSTTAVISDAKSGTDRYVASSKTAVFTVGDSSDPTVTFTNSKNKTLSITKTTDDTDVVDKSTPFYIEVNKTAGGSFDGAYTVRNQVADTNNRWDSTNDRFTIYIGETINITVQNDDVFTVKEVNIPANYSLTGVTGSGTNIQESSKTVGKTVTIGNDNAAVSFQNSINRHKVTVTKAYSTGDSSIAEHTVKVTVRPNGQSSDVGKTEYTETNFKKGSDFVVNNVPAGAYVTVAETACATGYELDNISESAFTMQNADKTVTVTNKLQKKTVTIVKKVVDKNGTLLEDTSEFKLNVTTDGTTTERTIKQSANVQFTVDYGTAVNVTEQDKAGYKLKDISTIPTKITQDTTITVTNYRVHDVTITKNVDDPNCTAYFPIKVKVDGAQIASLTGYTFAGTMPTTTGGNVYFDDDNDVFMIKAGQSFTIKDIIENTSVDVLEDTTDFGSGYAYNDAGSSVTENNGTAATSGNDKGFTGITVDKDITVQIANKALHTVEIQKTTDKTTSDTFNIQVIVGASTNLINATGYNVTLSGVNVDSDHYVFNKDGKITISGVPSGTQFKVVELDGGSADFKFNQTDSTVTGATKTAITTEGEYGYTFTTAHDNVTAIVNNTEAAKYQYEVTYKYEGYSLTTYNSDGTPKVGPQRSFKASGELSAADWTGYFGADGNKFVTDAKAMEFFGKTAPYEDDFMMDLEWETKNIQNMNVDRTNKKVTFEVTATTTPDRTVYVYFQLPYDVDENLVAKGNAYKTNQEHEATTQYGNWVKKNDSFVSAPLELQGSDGTYYFQYWQIKSTTADRTGSDRYKGKVETNYKKCFYADFNMTMYQDSYVTAVYTKGQADYNPAARSYEDTAGGEARINFIENSRNQWNSGGAPDLSKANQKVAGDRIYSDFLLTFGYQDLQLNTLNSANIKTGFVVEKVAELDTGTLGYETKTQSEYHHNDKYGSSEADAKTKVENMVKTGKTTDTGVEVKSGVTSSFIMNVNVDLKQLDNKNQMKYSLNMKNKEYETNAEPDDPYRNYVFRAYTYIKNGDTVVVSDPTYFTIYDMASIEPQA